MKSPLVSIVIPTYNRAVDLARAIKSIINQTYTNWECIIVDNYSQDSTDDVVKSFNDSRIKFFKIHNEGIIAISRNYAIRHAQGEYVAFLDSDDWWMPLKLTESLNYLNKGYDIVYHDLYKATKRKQQFYWRKVRSRKIDSPVFENLLRNGNALTNSSVVVRKNLFNQFDGLIEDKDFVGIEDFQGWLALSRLTEKFKRIPATLGYYWAGGGNVSNPKRSLVGLGAFEKYYANEIGTLTNNMGLNWLNYTKGRALYKVGSYEMAKKIFSEISFKKLPLNVGIKCVLTRCLLSFKCAFYPVQ